MKQLQIVKRNFSPLCFLPSGKLVCYRLGSIYILDNNNRVLKSFKIFKSKKESLAGYSNIIFRLFRLGIRASAALSENELLISVGNSIYEVDLEDGYVSAGFNLGQGIRPLIFSVINKIEGFDDGIYFGGYLVNPAKKPVHIYKRVASDQWEIVYTFEEGMINHVHNIVPDPFRNCLWIFTGDFDESSAIWKVTDNFKRVECVLCNDQKYRGCTAFALKEGLLYATDAPFAKNHINLLDVKKMEIRSLTPIDGSCIYGCQCRGRYVFSSTVEPDGRDSSLFGLLFGHKRGVGITDMYVHLYSGSISDGFFEIYREKKDLWPFLFQFGVFRFPYGKNDTDILYFQPVATSQKDLQLNTIDLSQV